MCLCVCMHKHDTVHVWRSGKNFLLFWGQGGDRLPMCSPGCPGLMMLETKLKSFSKVVHALHQAFSLAPENFGGLLLSYQRSNSGCTLWQQTVLLIEPSCWLIYVILWPKHSVYASRKTEAKGYLEVQKFKAILIKVVKCFLVKKREAGCWGMAQ